MSFKNMIIKILDLDPKGYLYLNQFSHQYHIASFFKIISRLGDRAFWYVVLAGMYITQSLAYSLSILWQLTYQGKSQNLV